MKTKLKLLFILLLTLSATSCLVDDEVSTEGYDQGLNLAGFERASEQVGITADGNTKDYDLRLKVNGPTSDMITQNVDVTIAVNEQLSTAVEGTHYMPLAQTSLTLSPEGNLLGTLPVTFLSAGINPPLAESPVLVIDVMTVNGAGVLENGRTGQVKITLNYLCFSNLEGTYIINYGSGPQPHYVTEVEPGLYEIDSMMGWPGAGYTVTFTDVCGDLTLLDDWQFSNMIAGSGYVDDVTGDIIWTTTTVEAVYDGNSWTMIKQ